jgi:hypothetical protein
MRSASEIRNDLHTCNKWFIIYRASDDDALEQYESVSLPALTLQDRINPTQKRTYRYAIAVTNGRLVSPLLQEISLQIP